MKRLLCLAVIAASSACQSTPRTPTAPDAVTPPATTFRQFAGVWIGEYRITSTTSSGHRPGTLVPFTLRLEQTSAVLRGHFQTTFISGPDVLIDVSGIVDDNGIMSLHGSAPGLGRVDFVGAATLTRFRARVDPTSGLAGDFEYRLDRTAESRLGFSTVFTGDIASAQRHTKALLPLTFDGTWVGSFVVRGCSQPCSPPFENEIGHFRLNLRQSGSSVTGLFWTGSVTEPPIEVTGHVEGDRLVLDPSATNGRSGILEWSTERDRYGRMVGTFVYEQRGYRRVVRLGTVSLMP
jgi:hypothetical protein